MKVGDKIKIKKLKDYGWDTGATKYSGAEGIITSIDDLGQLHGTWGGLAVIPEEDEFELVEDFSKTIEKIDGYFRGALDVPYTKFHETFYEGFQFESDEGVLAGMSVIIECLSDWGISGIVGIEMDIENNQIRIS